MLVSLGVVADAEVLDLFAGSGSFGIECLSRGAGHVTFVERNRQAAAVLSANLEHLGFARQATVRIAEVAAFLREPAVAGSAAVDLAFCDPPYALDPWAELLSVIPADTLVAHADHPIELTAPWQELRSRTYGRSHIVIAGRNEEPHF